jgi:hypothetical protein
MPTLDQKHSSKSRPCLLGAGSAMALRFSRQLFAEPRIRRTAGPTSAVTQTRSPGQAPAPTARDAT